MRIRYSFSEVLGAVIIRGRVEGLTVMDIGLKRIACVNGNCIGWNYVEIKEWISLLTARKAVDFRRKKRYLK